MVMVMEGAQMSQNMVSRPESLRQPTPNMNTTPNPTRTFASFKYRSQEYSKVC